MAADNAHHDADPRRPMLGLAAVIVGAVAVVVSGMVALLVTWAATQETYVSAPTTTAIVVAAITGLVASGYAVYAGVRIVQGAAYGGRWVIAILTALLMQVVLGALSTL